MLMIKKNCALENYRKEGAFVRKPFTLVNLPKNAAPCMYVCMCVVSGVNNPPLYVIYTSTQQFIAYRFCLQNIHHLFSIEELYC